MRAAAERIPDIVLKAKATSTNNKYDVYFQKFVDWCKLFSFDYLPADSNTLCVFLSYLVQERVSVSVLNSFFYAINWKHHLSLLSNPCENILVKMTLEGSKRILSSPVQKKEPVTVDMLKKIVQFYSTDLSLKALRICALCILGFSGFLRYSELSDIRMKDLIVFQQYVQINIKRSKTSQYRQGQNVIISKTGSSLCPVSWLNKYIAPAKLKP